MKITPKNWDTFQHYKDRRPAWIKLHHDLLDDFEFSHLPVESRALAPMLWLLASESDDGTIDYDLPKLAFRLRQTTQELAEALHPLLEAGFFIEVEAGVERQKWPSRHVPAKVRAEVLERDGHKCVTCSSTENLEIDHKNPVSRGGQSVPENLQTLCRSCNRSKRIRTAEQFATQRETQRSLETEKEKELEKEKDAASRTDFEDEKVFFRRGKEIFGDKSGGLLSRLLKAKSGKVALARAALELAATKEDGREYIGAIINKQGSDPPGPQRVYRW